MGSLIAFALVLLLFWFVPVFLQVMSWGIVVTLALVLLVAVLGLLHSPR